MEQLKQRKLKQTMYDSESKSKEAKSALTQGNSPG